MSENTTELETEVIKTAPVDMEQDINTPNMEEKDGVGASPMNESDAIPPKKKKERTTKKHTNSGNAAATTTAPESNPSFEEEEEVVVDDGFVLLGGKAKIPETKKDDLNTEEEGKDANKEKIKEGDNATTNLNEEGVENKEKEECNTKPEEKTIDPDKKDTKEGGEKEEEEGNKNTLSKSDSCTLQKVEGKKDCTITAHSGCEGTKPGSIASIEVGISNGADIIEIDIRIAERVEPANNKESEDGQKKTSTEGEDEKKKVTTEGDNDSKTEKGTKREYVKALVPVLAHDLKEKVNVKAVTLEYALKCVKEKNDTTKINLDLKEFENLNVVYDVINTCEMADRVFFTGVSKEDLVTVMNAAPDINLYVNVQAPGKTVDDDEALRKDLDKINENAKGKGRIIGINTHYRNISKKYIEFWHSHKYDVSVFTVNSADKAMTIIGYGANNITTKSPVAVIRAKKGTPKSGSESCIIA